jgi:hypothetical protein
VSTTVIALWLGHEQTDTTMIYLHADLTLKESLPPATPHGAEPTPVAVGEFSRAESKSLLLPWLRRSPTPTPTPTPIASPPPSATSRWRSRPVHNSPTANSTPTPT